MESAVGLVALAIGFLPQSSQSPYLFAVVFVLLGISEAAALLGRKTYLIDRVDAKARPIFVAFANSAIGLVALAFGGLGMVAQIFGVAWLLRTLVLMAVVGGLLALLPAAS